MKKKVLYFILIAILVIVMVASTILSVYYITKLKASPTFDTLSLVLSIGFIALTLFSIIMSFVIFVKVLKGESNGKSS